MITVVKYPERADWPSLTERPHFDLAALNERVTAILDAVRSRGDEALFEFERQFDGVQLEQLTPSDREWEEAESSLPVPLKEAIRTAHANIARFHAAQAFEPHKVETMPGVFCWQKAVGIEKVGLYVPGGTAPLFSTVLMLAVPAKIAGCREIVLCTPPDRKGGIVPAILYAARVAGVDRVYKLGGVQAIGAMAYGTESVPRVYKIFGPGNQYVMAAKQLVSLRDVSIDMPAGPSEVAVVADRTSDPAFVASDFLSQAEHGADSQSVLLTADESIIASVQVQIADQLAGIERRELAERSLAHSKIILLRNRDELIDLVNAYAPEHLIVQTEDYADWVDRIRNAGSVFLGPYSPESAGDYASGTNHTLPTSGYARAYSGVNLDSFTKKITFQEITAAGLQTLGPVVEEMAAAEGLGAHKHAVTVRLNTLKR